MSLWQFWTLVDGYVDANVPKQDRLKAPSPDEHDKAVEWFHARKKVAEHWEAVPQVEKISSSTSERMDAVLAQLTR